MPAGNRKVLTAQRALFVAPTLELGGAQRVFTTVLNGLAETEVDLHLALVRRVGPFLKQLSPRVTVHDLQCRRALTALPRLRRLICRLQPQAVLSTAFRMNLGVTLLQPWLPRGTRILIRETNEIGAQLGGGLRGRLLRTLASRTYRRADVIVCQSNFMQEDMQRALHLAVDRMRVVMNPVGFDELQRSGMEHNPFAGHGPGPHVLGVGRLVRAKGFDRLITAFPRLLARQPCARLWLLGDGPERPALARQAEQAGLSAVVQFAGVQSDPYSWMRHADLMAAPSRHEGTPNVVLEAIACECPLVVVDHPGGTREVMRLTGQEWRVVDDLSAWDDNWFARPPESVLNRARQLFDRQSVTEEYLHLMELRQPAAA